MRNLLKLVKGRLFSFEAGQLLTILAFSCYLLSVSRGSFHAYSINEANKPPKGCVMSHSTTLAFPRTIPGTYLGLFRNSFSLTN